METGLATPGTRTWKSGSSLYIGITPPHRPLIVRLPLLPMILPESNLADMTL